MFTPNITQEHNVKVGFVQDPDGRGTIGIIWVCLTVLILNTWTIIHPNIEPKEHSEWRSWGHKVYLAIIAAFAPDAVAATAFRQWRCARNGYKDLKGCLPWWTLEHAFYAEMGGYRVVSTSSNVPQEYAFRCRQLIWLHERKLIDIPHIDKKQLEERSKAEPIGKFVAGCQSSWFLISTLARVGQKLEITTLEAEMFPFVAVTWLVYWWWWRKPSQLTTYTEIPVPDLTEQVLIEMATDICCFDRTPPWWRPMPKEMHPRKWDYYWMVKRIQINTFSFEDPIDKVPSRLLNAVRGTMAEWEVVDWYRSSITEGHPNEWDVWDGLVIYAVGVWLYGFPLIVWDSEFPTEIERQLWRIANVGSIGLITLWAPVGYTLHRIGGTNPKPWKETAYYFIVFVVFLGRLYVMVEIFMGLRSCVPAVFETVDWSVYIPHIGS
ncbi:hypothetical protein QBC38DRAFT_484523 [Podospora fimiseda]|uniref:Uncharacterized protein n=1 Tax=Podospora fimiseda TaxID=252190 RepID=A0AAN7BKD7_9PEZI|nr:hypothetical protein QBC38DRAFT_484523 [Podospora fimiseda]